MGLFGNTIRATANKAYKGVVIFGANHFPDIMSEAQLQNFADAVDEAGQDVAKLRARLLSDTKLRDDAKSKFDTMKNAAKTLLERKATATAEQLPTIEEGISEATGELTTLKGALDDAERHVTETQSDLSAKEADLQKAATFLSTARQKLQDAQREKERLQDDVARQEQRKKEARKSVGIDNFDSSSAVLDAIGSQNDKLRQKAEGLRASNSAIEGAVTPKHSSALQDALDASKPAQQSDEDKLRSLLND